jgi:K+-sensing histidine kinase KdpD
MDELIDELIVDNLPNAVAFFNTEGMLCRNNPVWEIMWFEGDQTNIILSYTDFIRKLNILPLAQDQIRDICEATSDELTVRVLQMRLTAGATTGIMVEVEDISTSKKSIVRGDRILSDTMWKIRSRIATVQNVLTLFVDYRKDILDPESCQLLVNCRREVWELERQIENLRFLMLIDVGSVKLIPQPEELYVNELIENAVTQCEPLLRSFAEPPVVAVECDPALRFITDRRIVQKAISSLLFNALIYNDRSEPVLISAFADTDVIKITFEDHGWGIANDEQSSIFSSNYRGTNAKQSSYSGLGIELYLVRRLLMILDGGIEFISREKDGSRFTIFFRREGLQL